MDASSLRFRRLELGDVEAVHRLHGDPATNLHNPYGASPDLAASGATTVEWVRNAERDGVGYELVFDGVDLVGIGGARRDRWNDQPVLNLYWRLLPEFHGRGLSHPVATRALESTAEQAGEWLRVARMRPANVASARVAARVGLLRRPDLDGRLDGFEWELYADRAV